MFNKQEEHGNEKILITATAIVISVCLLCGCFQAAEKPDTLTKAASGSLMSDAVELVSDIPTTQYFAGEAVKEVDVETILTAGINAPSAMNGQPWHFSVITDAAVLEQNSGSMGAGMGFGGMMPPGSDAVHDGEFPEGMEPPEGVELPEGTELPPDDAVRPGEGELPEDFAPPGNGGGMPPLRGRQLRWERHVKSRSYGCTSGYCDLLQERF